MAASDKRKPRNKPGAAQRPDHSAPKSRGASKSTPAAKQGRKPIAGGKPRGISASKAGTSAKPGKSYSAPVKSGDTAGPKPKRTYSPVTKPSKAKSKSRLLAEDFLPPLAPIDRTNAFLALGVREELAAALAADGVTEPFAIQAATLPDAIAGRDVLGRAQTGSGKTLAFGLGMLSSLAFRRAEPHQPLGLVMVPTRELALQVDAVIKPLARRVRLSTQVVAGGMPYAKQLDALKRAVSILVATPGRLIDLVNKGALDLSRVQVAVLDEADQMCDMGFMPDMVTILDQVKSGGQRMLFSATLDGAVDTLVKKYLHKPIRHEVDSGRASVESMEHYLLVVEPKNKDTIVSQIGARHGRTIMFARTQLGAERIGAELAQAGVACGVLHGGMAQRVRTRTLAPFQQFPDGVLVATDVAARGIHVDGISLVVNVDAPTDSKDYLHRAGRTARAGRAGRVVTLTFSRQKQATMAMLGRAGVRPSPMFVRPMDRDLVRITGAKQPSGEPWTPPPMSGSAASGRPRPSRKVSAKAPAKSASRTKAKSADTPDARPSQSSRDQGERRTSPSRSADRTFTSPRGGRKPRTSSARSDEGTSRTAKTSSRGRAESPSAPSRPGKAKPRAGSTGRAQGGASRSTGRSVAGTAGKGPSRSSGSPGKPRTPKPTRNDTPRRSQRPR